MKEKSQWSKIQRHKILYLMLIPGMMCSFLFSYLPLSGLYIAFSDYKLGKPIFSAPFAGLKYFRQVFRRASDMGRILYNTLGMNLLTLFIGMILAMALAIMLNDVKNRKFKKLVQTSSFFPFFVSWVIVYNIVNTFFASESGIVNTVLMDLGIIKEGYNILGSPNYSWGLIIISNIWKTVGYNSILFLSSITSIDRTLYEAVDIDGADHLQKIWYITIPALMPTLQLLLIMNVGWIFASNFDQYYLFTNTMNKSTMTVFDYEIYKMGLQEMRYSFAAAVGMVKSVAGVSLLLIVNAISRKLNDTSVF